MVQREVECLTHRHLFFVHGRLAHFGDVIGWAYTSRSSSSIPAPKHS
ncbi:hypothetical protein I553_3138 [Mycobacterium xenopi 4042]|uniref:Uncharacterized protein n=1 Tax=Mycobacterium xenopi 4042 TaxID=1299334 RepID=X8E4V0_MYCXE|nr:hypothetical protein I553_3138 [Mycobacterium xenopi 4042]